MLSIKTLLGNIPCLVYEPNSLDETIPFFVLNPRECRKLDGVIYAMSLFEASYDSLIPYNPEVLSKTTPQYITVNGSELNTKSIDASDYKTVREFLIELYSNNGVCNPFVYDMISTNLADFMNFIQTDSIVSEDMNEVEIALMDFGNDV